MGLDTNDYSISFPVKASNSGSNGTILLTVIDSSEMETNGYRMDFNYVQRKWNVQRIVNGSPAASIVLDEMPAKKWTGVFEGVSIMVSEGNIPFSPDERHTFSTYKTQSPPKTFSFGITIVR